MFLAYLYGLLSLSLFPVSATSPHVLGQSTILSRTDIPPSQPLVYGNLALNGSTPENPDPALSILCDANLYGQNLIVKSCKTILRLLAKGEQQITFGDRDTALPFDAPLPYRVQSPDGICFLQVVLAPGKTTGHVSATQIGQAGYTLFDTCVKEFGFGGKASNIGGDNNLEVAIAKYKPNVQCDRSRTRGPPWWSCVKVFTLMRADRSLLTFGQRAGPGVDIELPFTLRSPDNRCQVRVDSTNPANSVSTFYEIWEGVNSIAYMCVRQNEKNGKAFKLGSKSNIYLELSDANPTAGLSGSSSSNTSSVMGLLYPGPGTQNLSSAADTLSLAPIESFAVSPTPVLDNDSSVVVNAPDDSASVGTS